MPIENKMVSRSLESAQKKWKATILTSATFVDYDGFKQTSSAIYKRRKEILEEYERENIIGGQSSTVIPRSGHCHPEQRGSSDSSLAAQNDNPIAPATVIEMVEREIEQFVYYHTGRHGGAGLEYQRNLWNCCHNFPIHSSEKMSCWVCAARGTAGWWSERPDGDYQSF